ncbi:MAG TPA: hypothetical protein VG890_12560 [Puia sp.]|nr:hypothetical protein [Puia sp.]
MKDYLPVSFVEEKILDLENALFFSTSEAVLKMPVCIVKILQVDRLGQLWFVVPRPTQFIYTFEKTFPVKLDFFRKGRDYFLKILGKAFIINDPEEINSCEGLSDLIKQKAMENDLVILKVKITNADYSEKNADRIYGKAWFGQLRFALKQLFIPVRAEQSAFFERIPSNQHIHFPAFSN